LSKSISHSGQPIVIDSGSKTSARIGTEELQEVELDVMNLIVAEQAMNLSIIGEQVRGTAVVVQLAEIQDRVKLSDIVSRGDR
jgi:hypothetical protein